MRTLNMITESAEELLPARDFGNGLAHEYVRVHRLLLSESYALTSQKLTCVGLGIFSIWDV